MLSGFLEQGIHIRSSGPEEQKVLCPKCSHLRKHKKEKCLSVNISTGTFNCHNCGFKGSVKYKTYQRQFSPIQVERQPPSEKMYDYFEKVRKIPRSVVDRNKIFVKQMPSGINAIGFPYEEHGVLYGAKYKMLVPGEDGLRKQYAQEPDCKQLAFKIDDVRDVEEIIITEGEEDAMSFEVAGYLNAVSLPAGASAPGQSAEGKMNWITNSLEAIESKKKIYLACDMDGPGRHMNEELARRLGRTRCYIVDFPDGCKDANEVLVKLGSESLKKCIELATPYPIEGIFTADAYFPDLDDVRKNGYPEGMRVGISSLDNQVRFMPGLIITLTGYPSDGKSNFWDVVMCRMAVSRGMRWAIYSPENYPKTTHLHRLAEILIGRPLVDRYNNASNITDDQYEQVKDFIKDHFIFLEASGDSETLESLLGKFEDTVLRYGVRGILLDPWNRIDHRYDGTIEEYQGRALNQFERFIQKHSLYGTIIAHPAKPNPGLLSQQRQQGAPSKNRYKPPTLYDISGSAHWYNKSGYGIVVYRNYDTGTTQIMIEKVKHLYWGKKGTVDLYFDHTCSRMNEVPEFDRSSWLSRVSGDTF